MKYCKLNNGKISNPFNLRKLLSNVLNPEKLTDTELKEKGIYLYQTPEFDNITQKTGDLVFDETGEVVTREVVNKVYDIQLEKDRKIKQIKRYVESLLRSTDPYWTRKQERGKDVPTEIQDERSYIHNECDRMKNEVQALTDVKSVLTYCYKLDNLQYHSITEV